MANKVKIPPEKWIKTARDALIAEGVAGVKVDRLAKRLNVTRGGFYHHFNSHGELLDQLINHWETSNDFLPNVTEVNSPQQALGALNAWMDYVIIENEFSPAYEMAMREWARIDARVKEVVERVDSRRIERITSIFCALGCDNDEASIRARVLYFHQIGFYSLGYHKRQTKQERMKNAPIYMRILGGRLYLDVAERDARKWA